jgi:hypothetical protein
MDEINAARVELGAWAPAPVEVVAPDPAWPQWHATARERVCARWGRECSPSLPSTAMDPDFVTSSTRTAE